MNDKTRQSRFAAGPGFFRIWQRILRMDKGKQPTPAAAPAQNMWPGALTEEEQKTVTDFDVNCRSFMVALSQLTILGSKIAAGWAGGIADLVNSLASTDLIPNTSGLHGAQPMGPADIGNIATYATQISDETNASQGTGGYNDKFIQALGVKAAGINASIGK
jgi:hypothetical protein